MAIQRNGVLIFSLALLSLTSMAAAGHFPKLSSTTMTIQGSIFCLSGNNKATPLPGGRARIECKAPGGGSISIISGWANDRGFYTATSSGIKLVACKAFLYSSPIWGCRFPTDNNGGKRGSPIIAFSPLSQLFSVKPLFYSPSPSP